MKSHLKCKCMISKSIIEQIESGHSLHTSAWRNALLSSTTLNISDEISGPAPLGTDLEAISEAVIVTPELTLPHAAQKQPLLVLYERACRQ